MKKNLLVSRCLGAVAAVSAQANASNCKINSGAYAGVGAGVSVLSGKNILTLSNDQGGGGPQVTHDKGNFSLSKTSLAGILFAGYGVKISGFWVAGELSYQIDGLKNKQEPMFNENSTNLKSSSTGAYGAAVHLGFMPSENCAAYAILGVEARKFNIKFSADSALSSATISKNYRSIAFAPGVGVRFALAKNISIRTEYKYAMHRSKTFTSSAAHAAFPDQTDMATVKHQPKAHTFNVGVVYSF